MSCTSAVECSRGTYTLYVHTASLRKPALLTHYNILVGSVHGVHVSFRPWKHCHAQVD